MSDENMNQEFWWKKIDGIRNYLIEEINRNDLMSKKQKKVCRVSNYIDHSLIAISAITGYVSISAFSSLSGTPITITSSAIALNICVITARVKKYKPIIKKKGRNMIN